MAAVSSFLSVEQFDQLYEGEKPHFEYWFGVAVQKSMPTALHGLLQGLIMMLLLRRGWKATVETRLKISRVAQPVPDVVADHARIQDPYPTEPFDLCIEILSPQDRLPKVFEKCAHYLDWGIGSTWIIDPKARKAYSMSRESPVPVEIGITGALTAGAGGELILPLRELFAEVDKMLGESAH